MTASKDGSIIVSAAKMYRAIDAKLEHEMRLSAPTPPSVTIDGLGCVVEGCRADITTINTHFDYGGRVVIVSGRCHEHRKAGR